MLWLYNDMKEKKVICKLWNVAQMEGGVIFCSSLKTKILRLLECALSWVGGELINSPLALF